MPMMSNFASVIIPFLTIDYSWFLQISLVFALLYYIQKLSSSQTIALIATETFDGMVT